MDSESQTSDARLEAHFGVHLTALQAQLLPDSQAPWTSAMSMDGIKTLWLYSHPRTSMHTVPSALISEEPSWPTHSLTAFRTLPLY